MSKIHNTGDPDQVKNQARRERDIRDQQLNDLRVVMSTQQGRRFIFRLINEICHYDTISAQQSGSFTYFREGERQVGMTVKEEVYEACFDQYQVMEKEFMQRKLKGDVNV